jgi:hypothetical protein
MIEPSVVNFLLSGPVMQIPERREATIIKMAEKIAEAGVIGDRKDAILVLHAAGYGCMQIDLLVDEARALAFQDIAAEAMQDIVAREMNKS